jgi:hypothetical protein
MRIGLASARVLFVALASATCACGRGTRRLELYLSGLFPNGTPLPTVKISIGDGSVVEGNER